MRFPVVRERVRVHGRSGTFRVLSVDRARGVASIVATGRGGIVENDVPLASILPLADEQGRGAEPDGDSKGKD